MPNKKDMLERLRNGLVSLPPLSLRSMKDESKAGQNLCLDAMVEVSWGETVAMFAVECRALWTPRAFRDGLNALKTAQLPEGVGPMLFIPFLSEQQLQVLEQEAVSGIDLCGNGVVMVPEKLAVFRSGEKNRFTSSAPIKNIYRKNSSMVARSFLVCPRYETVQDVRTQINDRNLLVSHWGKKTMSLSTVSKVLKTLEEDLVISRADVIRLIQPETLIQKLSDNYVAPIVKNRVRMKIPEQLGTVTKLLYKESQSLGLPVMSTGLSSIGQYAVMQRGDILSVYCPQLPPLLERLHGDRSDRFPNIELIEVEDETVYFDARLAKGFQWASPVQVYLELMAGDKRDQEIAQQVKSTVMDSLSWEPL